MRYLLPKTSVTTAWRYWNWDPSSDRDFIGLPVTSISAAPSTQRQWTEEARYAGVVSPRVNFVVGVFAFRQTINSNPSFKQEQGSAAARFLLAPGAAAATPGLLDGYGFNQYVQYGNTSAALFSQLTVSVTNPYGTPLIVSAVTAGTPVVTGCANASCRFAVEIAARAWRFSWGRWRPMPAAACC